MPAAVINNRNTEATTNSASTLPPQMMASQPTRFHHGWRITVLSSISLINFFIITSMVALIVGHFSAEYVVAPEGVDQNDRNNDQRTDQHKAQALRRCGGFPQRHGRRDDVRPDADPKPAVAEENQHQRQQERCMV